MSIITTAKIPTGARPREVTWCVCDHCRVMFQVRTGLVKQGRKRTDYCQQCLKNGIGRKWTGPRGDASPLARIKTTDILAFVGDEYHTMQEIADHFGVSHQRISHIVRRRGITLPERDEYTDDYIRVKFPHSRWPKDGIMALKIERGYCRENGCWRLPEPGKVRCQEHLDAVAARSIGPQMRRYRQRRAAGLCVVCGIPTGGKAHCPTHAAKVAEYGKRSYQKRKQQLQGEEA